MSLKVLIAPVAVFCFIYFVIPFSLDAGSKLIVVTDEDNILLKPVIAPDLREFDALINESQRWASD